MRDRRDGRPTSSAEREPPVARSGRGAAALARPRRLRRRRLAATGSATVAIAGCCSSVRRRARSPASRIRPLMNRKMLAATGLAKTVRKTCSSARPVMPTGIVARTISQARRSSESRTLNRRSRMLRGDAAEEPADDAHPVGAEEPQQRERGGAVQGDDVGEVEGRLAVGLRGLGDQRLPACRRSRPGTSTECPRLETGNSSVTPWTSAMTMAWRYVMDPLGASSSPVSGGLGPGGVVPAPDPIARGVGTRSSARDPGPALCRQVAAEDDRRMTVRRSARTWVGSPGSNAHASGTACAAIRRTSLRPRRPRQRRRCRRS